MECREKEIGEDEKKRRENNDAGKREWNNWKRGKRGTML